MSLAISSKPALTIRPGNALKGNESLYSYKDPYTSVHSSLICNSKKTGTNPHIPQLVNGSTKQLQQEKPIDKCNNMGEP